MPDKHLIVRRGRTVDRGPPSDDEGVAAIASIYTVERLGRKREKTSQGYLLCRDVPLARTGEMLYRVGEVPVRPALGDPILRVSRTRDELFSPETMGSFIGAPITYEHPPVDVTPENWKQLAKGYIMTVRQGTGDDADCLMGDLLVTDKWLIEQIDQGKREVSLGYDAGYKTVAPGVGLQYDIIGNHIALVERGRCGPRCAIGDSAASDPDHQPQAKESRIMGKRVDLEEARARVRELEAEEAQGDDNAVHVHIHTDAPRGKTKDGAEEAEGEEGEGQRTATVDKATAERLDKIEAAQAKTDATLAEILAAVKEPKAATATKDTDSVGLESEHQEFVAQAEILVPGFRTPTFDSASPRKATVDSICAGRRSVMLAAYATKDGKSLVDSITGKSELALDKMSCDEVATTFRAAAAAKGAMNNRAATGDSASTAAQQAAQEPKYKQKTLAEINAENAAFWAANKA